ncbi:MAG: sigma-70 family RNA polymerase sigma factor [Oscillospiraceae bacterium]|nr:sigma-70 family RNA polymerase sigma factor [Oscillospiraceae bacterium]
MKTNDHYNRDTERFEQLYREHFPALLRFAMARLRARGSTGTHLQGQAEEAVQETFSFAWVNRGTLFASPAPLGWLINVCHYKVLELLREEHMWSKRLLRVSERITEGGSDGGLRLRAEMRSILSEEEYTLLKKLYLDGYTYRELSQEMGLKQSALAMRIKRLKERVSREWKEEK